jgi:hypothetical protein
MRVEHIREFRDRFLLTSSIGRVFVDMYYRWSHPIARIIAQWKPVRVLVRLNLMPVIGFCALVSKTNIYSLLVVFILLVLGGLFVLKRTHLGRRGQW